jgi:hypothetical protein
MKKQVLFLVLFSLCTLSFGQRITIRASFDEVKWANRGHYEAGSEKMRSKYYPSLSNGGRIVFNVTGGKRDGQYIIMPVKPLSFEERDVPTTWTEGQQDFWRVNVLPYLEDRQTDILEYLPNFSTAKFEEGRNSEKYEMTEYTITDVSVAGSEVRRKISKVWEKRGDQMLVFSTYTGENRVYHLKRLPNGLKDLDAANNIVAIYDELHGKGAWDKDAVIINKYWKRTDRYLLGINKALSSN